MVNEPIMTLVGNLAGDPELRFTSGGKAVANFTVASTPRVKDGDQWADGETLWVRCAVWGQPAEHVAESLTKGVQVIVQGRLRAKTWQDRDGQSRTSMEMDVDHVGPSLQWATAKVTRANGNSQQSQGGQPQRPQAQQAWAHQQNDPWAMPSNQPATF